MRAAITLQDVEELEFPAPDHRRGAQQLLEWAQTPHPDDELSPRELLTRAGEQLELAGDGDAALDTYLRAVSAEGPAAIDPRSHLVALLLDRGEHEEARRWDRELRRDRPAGAEAYEYMGGVWEEIDDQRALGWYTRGTLLHEQGPGFSDADLAQLCLARWQLRERLDYAPDDYDFIGVGLLRRLEQAQQRHPPAAPTRPQE